MVSNEVTVHTYHTRSHIYPCISNYLFDPSIHVTSRFFSLELNMSILPHDVRLNAIVEGAEHFDHRDKARHDYELHEGT